MSSLPSSNELFEIPELPQSARHISTGDYSIEKGPKRLLDIHYKLLREDFIRPIRDAIKDFTEFNNKNSNYYEYFNIKFDSFVINELKGVCLRLSFDSKVKLFKGIKRLQHDSLVILNLKQEFIVGVVCNYDIRMDDNNRYSIDFYVIDNIKRFYLMNNIRKRLFKVELLKCGVLIEIKNLLVAAYEFPLVALQQITLKNSLPFKEYFAPLTNLPFQLKPPKYSSNPDFKFKLNTILKPPFDSINISFDVKSNISKKTAKNILEASSILDVTQSVALVDALSSDLALIQVNIYLYQGTSWFDSLI